MSDLNQKPLTRTVKCPQCGNLTLYSPENLFRPFCSERCRLIDLGEWASEGYRIPTNEIPEVDSLNNPTDHDDETLIP